MRRALASSLLSLLLLTTLVWGGCVSCEQYFMWSRSKGCCGQDGRCQKTAPEKPAPARECKQIAFEHHKSFDLHIDLPVVAVAIIQPPVPPAPAAERWSPANPVEPSPPDLQVLHSTFLI